jgi:hypothetical protein
MQFDSIYHLHIPRTAGIFIRSNLLSQFNNKKCFADHYIKIDDKEISESYFVGGHWGKYPISKMNNPLIFTVLRDPVERFISYFNYIRPLFTKMKREELLEYWLYDEKMSSLQSNLQFKFLSSTIDPEQYNLSFDNKNRVEKAWFLKDQQSYENTIDFINNIEVFIVNNDISIEKQISNKLNIKPFAVTGKANKSEGDLKIFNKHYDRIKELNKIDLEIYDYVKAQRY